MRGIGSNVLAPYSLDSTCFKPRFTFMVCKCVLKLPRSNMFQEDHKIAIVCKMCFCFSPTWADVLFSLWLWCQPQATWKFSSRHETCCRMFWWTLGHQALCPSLTHAYATGFALCRRSKVGSRLETIPYIIVYYIYYIHIYYIYYIYTHYIYIYIKVEVTIYAHVPSFEPPVRCWTPTISRSF